MDHTREATRSATATAPGHHDARRINGRNRARSRRSMIYLDSSVVLAHFLVETQRLPDRTWEQPLTSSRLLEYEVWTRLHAKGLGRSLRPAVLDFLLRVEFVDLAANVLARA